MNSGLYRLVFSERVRMYVAVAETSVCNASGSVARPAKPDMPRARRGAGLDRMSALAVAALTAALPSPAQIVVSPAAPRNQQATLLQTANGLPQINIQTPSAAGVSRNVFSQFDVGGNGAILNNGRTNSNTRLAGWVSANPSLAAGSAKVILNEVKSSAATQLSGYLEIAGSKAELVIASPAGITCSGCGFLNASRAVLTTGVPQFASGAISGYSIGEGRVRIEGLGLDASQIDSTAIFARAVEVNAGIRAKELKVAAGAAAVDGQGAATGPASAAGLAPGFALDVAAVGGMYANRIWIVGNEAGLGVRNAGLISSTGGIDVSVAGGLNNPGQISGASGTSIRSTSLQNDGVIYDKTRTALAVGGPVVIGGITSSQGDLAIQSTGAEASVKVTTGGVIAAGIDGDGKVGATGSIRLESAGTAALQGRVVAPDDIELAGSTLDLSASQISGGHVTASAGAGGIEATGATINAITRASLQTSGALRTDEALVNATQLQIAASSLSNVRGEIQQSGSSALTLTLSGALDNTGGRIAANATDLSISASAIQSTNGRIEHGGAGELLVRAGRIDNAGGMISGPGTVTIEAGDLSSRGGTVQAYGSGGLSIRVTRTVETSQSGRLVSAQGLRLSAGGVANAGGTIASGGELDLTAGLDFDNTGGLASSAAGLRLRAANVLNDRGRFESARALDLGIDGRFDNLSGSVYSNEALALSAGTLSSSGSLYGTGNATLTVSGAVSNTGLIASRSSLQVNAQSLQSGPMGVLAAGMKPDGKIADAGDLTVQTAQALALSGQAVAAGRLSVTSSTADISGSSVRAQDVAIGTSVGDLIAKSAELIVAKGLHLQAGSAAPAVLHIESGRVSAPTVSLHAGSVLAADSRLLQTGAAALSVALPGALDLQGAEWSFNAGNASFSAARILASRSRLLHAGQGQLSLAADDLAAPNARWSSNGSIAVSTTSASLAQTSIAAQALDVQSSSLDLRQGEVLLYGSDPSRWVIAGALDNSGGTIASNGNLTVDAGSLLNGGGKMRTAGSASLALSVSGPLTNSSGGLIASEGPLSLAATVVDNTAGIISGGNALSLTASDALRNDNGRLVARGALALETPNASNRGGVISSVESGVAVDSANGRYTNDGGRTEAAGTLSVNAQEISNQEGALVGGQVRLRANPANSTSNANGVVAAANGIDYQGGRFDNDGGLVQSQGTVTLDTGGAALANTRSGRDGGIVANGAVTLKAGSVANTGGYISSGATMQVSATGVNNHEGTMVSGDAIAIDAGTGSVDNRAGLIRGVGSVRISAAGVDNSATSAAGLGVEGRSVRIDARRVANVGGSMHADADLQLTVADRLDNTRGVLSSAGALAILDPSAGQKTLAVVNGSGTVIAGERAALDVATESGDGQLLSLGALSLTTTSAYALTGEVRANGNLGLTIGGGLTNAGRLRSGGVLTLTAESLDNLTSGELVGASGQMSFSGALTNRGLIDGGDLTLKAPVLRNIGSGRIFGDHLAIAAADLQNDLEAGQAGVIAARVRLDVATNSLLNNEGALMFSAGDLGIGGALDSSNRATGRATSIDNKSATIEALNNLDVSADRISNLNNHFTTKIARLSTVPMIEFQGSGSPNRYGAAEVSFTTQDRATYLITPDGLYHDWFRFDFDRITTETQVATSSPGKILAAGSMSLSGGSLLNDKSQIIAGGALTADLTNLVNTQMPGERTMTDAGTATQAIRTTFCARRVFGVCVDRDFTTDYSTTAYSPAQSAETIQLQTTRFAQHTATQGSGTVLNPSTGGGVSATGLGVSGAGAGVRPAGTAQVEATVPSVAGAGSGTVSPAGPGTASTGTGGVQVSGLQVPSTSGGFVIRTVSPPSTVPASGLYRINTDPGSAPLVVTDPRFADYRMWLSSDYMLAQLSINPAAALKRIGDGFYEQQVVRDQVVAITGRRFLPGFTNDEEQYQALMMNGVLYAKEVGLVPGVALTAEQMAKLTSDIVWLVKQTVPVNGKLVDVLVPQVYARAGSADPVGSVAQISGSTIDLWVGGNVLNDGGTFLADRRLTIASDSLTNTGVLRGNEVIGNTRGDLRIVGGSVLGQTLVQLTAHGNLDVASTLRETEGPQGAHISISGVAGVYVQGPAGQIALNADRDVKLAGAEIQAGNGRVSVQAGNDIVLSTQTVGSSMHIVFGPNGYLKSQEQLERGTLVQGDQVDFQAKRDASMRAATVISNTGTLAIQVGRDAVLQGGEARRSFEHFVHDKADVFLGKVERKEKITYDDKAPVFTQLSGGNVSLAAGNRISLAGGAVDANESVRMTAPLIKMDGQKQVTETTVDRSQTQSGLTISSTGLFYGRTNFRLQGQEHVERFYGDLISSRKGDVQLIATQSVIATGTGIRADGGTVSLAAPRIDILAGYERSHSLTTVKSSSSGLTISLPMLGLLQETLGLARTSLQQQDPRYQLVGSAAAGLKIYNAYQGATRDNGQINLARVSVGSSSSTQTTFQSQNVAVGAQVQARKIEVDSGVDGTRIEGGTLRAADSVSLTSAGSINLEAARNEYVTQTTSRNQGWSLGVSAGINPSSGKAGISIDGQYNAGRGRSEQRSIDWTASHIFATDIQVTTPGAVRLFGSSLDATHSVAVNAKSLEIASAQREDTYTSRHSSVGVGFSVTVLGTGGAQLNANLSTGGTQSLYRSVVEQAGIRAGEQVSIGVDQFVTRGTVIQAPKQDIKANSIVSSDLLNDARVSTYSVGFGGGIAFTGADGSNTLSNATPFAGMPVAMRSNERTSSVTRAAIGQPGGVPAFKPLERIFDPEKIRAQQQIVGAFSQELSQFLKDKAAEADQARKKVDEMTRKLDAQDAGLTPQQRQERRAELLEDLRRADATAQAWGPGGLYSQLANGLVAALTGNLSASTSEVAGRLLVNFVQQRAAAAVGELVKSGALSEGDAAHVALHAAIGCAGSALSGSNCVGGALGAAGAAALAGALPPLRAGATEEEKAARGQFLIALVTGLGTVAGADATAVRTSSQAATDNNFLASEQRARLRQELLQAGSLGERVEVALKYGKLDLAQEFLWNTAMLAGFAGEVGTTIQDLVQLMDREVLKQIFNQVVEISKNPQQVKELARSMGQAFVDEMESRLRLIAIAKTVGGEDNVILGGEAMGKLVGDFAMIWAGGAVAKSGAQVVAKLPAALTKSIESALGRGATATLESSVAAVGAAAKGGGLTFDKAAQTWTSSGGLVYGQGSVHGNRLKHVLAHTIPDPTKSVHSVFNVGRDQVVGLLDEAWALRTQPLPSDPGAYLIPMGRVVGQGGETNIRIIVRPGTSEVITAHPVK
jgi:filamentous hemagglutinin